MQAWGQPSDKTPNFSFFPIFHFFMTFYAFYARKGVKKGVFI